MRKTITIILLFICVTLRAQASVTFLQNHIGQTNFQCDFEQINNPIMLTCIDWIDPINGIIAGWNADKRTNHQSLGYFLLKDGNPISFNIITVARPDVAAYIGTSDQNLGFGLLTGPLSPGLYTLETSDIPWSWDCRYDQYNGFWCDWISTQITFRVN